MKRTNAAQQRWRAFLLAGALSAVVGSVLIVGGWGQRGDGSDCTRDQGNGALVVLECEGWSSGNVPLGVFAEGTAEDGGRRFEHLLFDGTGSHAIDFSVGECAAVPQLPQIMLQDGRVLCAGEPARSRCSDGGGAQLRLAYAAVDLHGATDDELAAIAAVSFLDENVAACALESAKALRDRAAEKEEDHA